jgi:hypothetical protein
MILINLTFHLLNVDILKTKLKTFFCKKFFKKITKKIFQPIIPDIRAETIHFEVLLKNVYMFSNKRVGLRIKKNLFKEKKFDSLPPIRCIIC